MNTGCPEEGDADGDPVDPEFLKKAFPDYDGVSVKGFEP